MNLAVVINTTDKYSHIWDAWHYYFKKYWRLNLPIYFLNEKKNIPYPFNQIKVNIPEKKLWTKKFRESIKQIPEDNLFILLEDLFFVNGFYEGEFESIYQYFLSVNADALRIQPKSKHTITYPVSNPKFRKLASDSPYLICHQPNIWKKEFLLECIKIDESPWVNEIKGTARLRGEYNIYQYDKDWFVNVLRQGKIVPQYKYLLNCES